MNSVLRKLPQSGGSKRLILFHHAGGSGAQYFPSLKSFVAECEIHAMDLPGRFFRLGEEPFVRMSDLVAALRGEILALPPLPTYFLGHSFGALVAYALAWDLRQDLVLRGLGLSAMRGSSPERRIGHERLVAMSDQDLVVEIEKFQELPAVVKRDPAILGLTLRALRNDFQVMTSFENIHRAEVLPVPTLVFGGNRDPQVSVRELEEWRGLVNMQREPVVYAGDHFYIFSQMRSVMTELLAL